MSVSCVHCIRAVINNITINGSLLPWCSGNPHHGLPMFVVDHLVLQSIVQYN